MIELKLLIDELDYDSLAERLMPKILEKADPSELEPWARLLVLANGLNASTVSKIISRMPKEKKDAMVVRYINRNRDRIAGMLADMAAGQGIKAHVLSVEAQQR